MTLLQLTYFCAIAKCLNYNQAARELFVSQPTLSKSIAALENELGFFLFERKGKYVHLTKYGQLYYEQIKVALDIIQTTTASIKQMSHENTGHIDIAYNPPFAQGFVPESVSNFLSAEKGRQITVQFNQASSTKIVRGILDGSYDVGFLTMIPNIPDLTFIPLMSEKMVAIVPARHPLAGKKKIRLADLEPYPLVNYIPEAGLRPIVDNYLNQALIAPTICCSAPDERSIASLVSSGVGVALVAQVSALNDFNVRQIDVIEPECERIIYLTYDSNRYLTPVVQQFISYIKKITKDFR